MKKSIYTNTLFVALCAVICCALWGSATPFIKLGYRFLEVEGTPSIILFAGIRFFIAGILTVVIYSVARRKVLHPKPQNIKYVLKLSAFQTVIQYIFFYIGLANTTGVKGTIGSASNVFFAILIASLIFKQEKLTVKKIFACLVGFAGIIVVNLKGLDLNFNFFGDCFVIFSAIAYATSSVLMKRYSQYEDPVVLSGYQFVAGGLVMIALGAAFGGSVSLASAKGIGVLIYLSFLSSIAYSLWGILLKHNPVSKVTVYSFSIPVFGVALSAMFLNESGNVSAANLIIALILICTGVLTLNYKKSNTPEIK